MTADLKQTLAEFKRMRQEKKRLQQIADSNLECFNMLKKGGLKVEIELESRDMIMAHIFGSDADSSKLARECLLEYFQHMTERAQAQVYQLDKTIREVREGLGSLLDAWPEEEY